MNILKIIKQLEKAPDLIAPLQKYTNMRLPIEYIDQYKDVYTLFVATKPAEKFATSIYAAVAHSEAMAKSVEVGYDKKDIVLTLANIKTLHKHNYLRGNIGYDDDGNVIKDQVKISLEDVELWTSIGVAWARGVVEGVFEKNKGSEYTINLQDSKNGRSKVINKLDGVVKMLDIIVDQFPEDYRESITNRLLRNKID